MAHKRDRAYRRWRAAQKHAVAKRVSDERFYEWLEYILPDLDKKPQLRYYYIYERVEIKRYEHTKGKDKTSPCYRGLYTEEVRIKVPYTYFPAKEAEATLKKQYATQKDQARTYYKLECRNALSTLKHKCWGTNDRDHDKDWWISGRYRGVARQVVGMYQDEADYIFYDLMGRDEDTPIHYKCIAHPSYKEKMRILL